MGTLTYSTNTKIEVEYLGNGDSLVLTRRIHSSFLPIFKENPISIRSVVVQL